jgi:hypothetical protein
MTQWETIYDSSSHISQVRLVPPKNYSVERGNGIFDGNILQFNKQARTHVYIYSCIKILYTHDNEYVKTKIY